MKRTTIILLAILAVISCNNLIGANLKGSGKIITKQFTVIPFIGVQASNAARVNIVQGTGNTISVRANEKVMPQLRLGVREGILYVGLKSSWHSQSNITLEVTVPSDGTLRELESSGAAQITSTVIMTAPKLEIEASGASKIALMVKGSKCEVDISGASRVEIGGQLLSLEGDVSGASRFKAVLRAEKCDLDISGASQVELEGAATQCEVELSGASSLSATTLEVGNYQIDASGASQAAINCTGQLTAEVSSASRLTYTGSCVLKDAKASSAGSITRQ